jgi:hypothetical protein
LVVKLSVSSPDISVFLSIELPFWVSMESGDYLLGTGQDFQLHNDFWLVTTGSIVDGPFNDYIVNEIQVENQEYLNRITANTAKYFHKRKMKTTFTRGLTIKQAKISAKEGTENWQRQLEKVVFHHVSVERCDQFLSDINSFLDQYCSLIIPSNNIREVRRVSFYETMLRVLVTVDITGARFLYSTKVTPDIQMADFPFPRFRVRRIGESSIFKELIQIGKTPSFHQLQWATTLNHNREQSYQEALLSAAIALESLSHVYLKAIGLKTREERESEISSRRGMAGWIESLNPPNLNEECKEVARLWVLRNSIVHRQKKLVEKDIVTIKKGIRSLAKLREFFLSKAEPELAEMEEKFSDFLEPIQLGTAAAASIKGIVPIQIEWRREKDHYQTVHSVQTKTNESNPE